MLNGKGPLVEWCLPSVARCFPEHHMLQIDAQALQNMLHMITVGVFVSFCVLDT